MFLLLLTSALVASPGVLAEEQQEYCTVNDKDSCSESAVKITAKYDGIHGSTRYVLDGLLTEEQCKRFIEINDMHGVYGGNFPKHLQKRSGSPYTAHETFKSVEIPQMEELAKKPKKTKVTKQDVESIKKIVADTVVHASKLYKRPLVIEYPNLQCREAIEDDIDKRDAAKDPSHTIHADNCYNLPNGDCILSGNLALRNVSSILYLNEDFEGGEFFFAKAVRSPPELSIKPKCGRLVVFDSREYHGVLAVMKGKRCGIAMWYQLG